MILFFANKAKKLVEEIVAAAKDAPSIMIVGALISSLLGIIQFVLLMAPLKAIFLKISGVKIIHIPGSMLSINVDTFLLFVAAGLLGATVATATAGFVLEEKRKAYVRSLILSGQRHKANNINPFYSIIRGAISFSGIFPILLFINPWLTLQICILLILIVPLFIISRRFAATENRSRMKHAILNSRTTGALTVGVIIAAAIVHIAFAGDISHEAAVYLLIYFLLLRQLAAAAQRAADGFHKVRI